MKQLGSILLVVLAIHLLSSCELKPFDSEAIPVSETQYFSALEPPSWIKEKAIYKISLTDQFNVDSLINNLDRYDECEMNVFCLDYVIPGYYTRVKEDSIFVVSNLMEMDSTIGNHENLSQLLRLGKIKGMKFILDWHGVVQSNNNASDRSYKIVSSDKDQRDLLRTMRLYQGFGFNGFVCNDMDRMVPDFWQMVYETFEPDTNFVLIGDSKDTEWLSNSFHFLVEKKASHSATQIYNATFSELRSLKYIPFQLAESQTIIVPIGNYRNHHLLNKVFNGPAYLIDFKPELFNSTWKDSICNSFSSDLSLLGNINSIFKEGVSTTMDIDQGLTVIRKNKEGQDLRLILNNSDEIKTYYSSTPYMFTDLVTDSATALNITIDANSYRLVHYKK